MLSELGLEAGPGNMIGVPNQTIGDIVKDLLFIRHFNLTMASTFVFVPGENSNYRNKPKGEGNIWA